MRIAIMAALAVATAAPAVGQTMTDGRSPAGLPRTFNLNVARVPPTACPEGRTRDGACVNPVAAQFARQTAIVATQSKISISAGPPAAPAYDPYFAYPNSLYRDMKRELDMQLGRRSSSYIPNPYHTRPGPGTPFPPTYPVRPPVTVLPIPPYPITVFPPKL